MSRPSLVAVDILFGRVVKVAHHEERGQDPVDADAENNLLPHRSLREESVQRLVADFTQNRVHHNEEADGCKLVGASGQYRYRSRAGPARPGSKKAEREKAEKTKLQEMEKNEKESSYIPIGTDTPTNLPFCRAGPVEGTKFPRIMPTAMARKIQRARKRSIQPRALKAEKSSRRGASAPGAVWLSRSVDLLSGIGVGASCFSVSVGTLVVSRSGIGLDSKVIVAGVDGI